MEKPPCEDLRICNEMRLILIPINPVCSMKSPGGLAVRARAGGVRHRDRATDEGYFEASNYVKPSNDS